jgi:hypothetical protein
MASGTGILIGAQSPRAKAWVIAAIILVLHWSIPGALPLDAAVEPGDAAPALSSEARALQPGTIPRALPREPRCEASAPKAHKIAPSASGKTYALPPRIVAVVSTRIEAVAPGVDDVEPPSIARRFFDPRAPPPPMA